MNGNIHSLVGGILGGVAYVGACKILNEKPTWGGAFLSLGAGAVVARIHDVLEPATNPNHRAFFHSLVFNGTLVFIVWRICKSPTIHPMVKRIILAIGLPFLDGVPELVDI